MGIFKRRRWLVERAIEVDFLSGSWRYPPSFDVSRGAIYRECLVARERTATKESSFRDLLSLSSAIFQVTCPEKLVLADDSLTLWNWIKKKTTIFYVATVGNFGDISVTFNGMESRISGTFAHKLKDSV